MISKKKLTGIIGEELNLKSKYIPKYYQTGSTLEEENNKISLARKIIYTGSLLINAGLIAYYFLNPVNYKFKDVNTPSQFENETPPPQTHNSNDKNQLSILDELPFMVFKYTGKETLPFQEYLKKIGVKDKDIEIYRKLNPQLSNSDIKTEDIFRFPVKLRK